MDYALWLDHNLTDVIKDCLTLELDKGPNDYVIKEYSIKKIGITKKIWLSARQDCFRLESARSLENLITFLAGPPAKRRKNYPVWKITEPAALKHILATLDGPSIKDFQFFLDAADQDAAVKPFAFKPGHVERGVNQKSKSASPEHIVNRLHNEIQNKLYTYLVAELSSASVGTEQNTGSGTVIDLVTQHNGKTTFYEIKTGDSVRTNIRQAIPQLLEYAFWSSREWTVELIVVSHLPITPDAHRYMEFLKNYFGIPIEYRQFDLTKGVLA